MHGRTTYNDTDCGVFVIQRYGRGAVLHELKKEGEGQKYK